MGSAVLLTVTRAEDPSRVIEALDEREIVYFPRISQDSPETTLEVGGQRYYGEDEIIGNLGSIAAEAKTSQ
jgi:hypothetical protein